MGQSWYEWYKDFYCTVNFNPPVIWPLTCQGVLWLFSRLRLPLLLLPVSSTTSPSVSPPPWTHLGPWHPHRCPGTMAKTKWEDDALSDNTISTPSRLVRVYSGWRSKENWMCIVWRYLWNWIVFKRLNSFSGVLLCFQSTTTCSLW